MKPRKGESKQVFFKRAIKKFRDGGMNEEKAMQEASRIWNEHNLNLGSNGTVNLNVPVQFDLAEDEANETPRRFSILANTGKIIDLGWYRFVINIKGIEHKATFPCFREHDRNRIVGTHDKVKKTTELYCFGRFHDTPDADEIIKLADDGFDWQASVGIRAKEVIFIKANEKTKVNGHEVAGPCHVWQKSELLENSICTLGADGDTAAVTLSCQTSMELDHMKYSTQLKLALGLTAEADDDAVVAKLTELKLELNDDATEPEAWAALAGAGLLNKEEKSAPVNLEQNLNTQTSVDPAPASPSFQDNMKLERERTADIQQLCSKLSLPDSFAQLHIKDGTDINTFRKLALNEALDGNQPVGALNLSMGNTQSDKMHSLAVDGLCFKLGITEQKDLADGAQQFASIRLTKLAEMFLQDAGLNTTGMSERQIAQLMLKPHTRLASPSTADFPSIFADVANKRLLKSYSEASNTFAPFVNVVPASDFKEIYGITLSEAPDLELVGENEDYTVGALKDKQESYHMAKYGKMLKLSLEMLINDDLRAFDRIPRMFGAAARRKEGDVVYKLITSNPQMKDGKTLFHIDRGNLTPTADGGVPNTTTISTGRKAMRNRKGLKGAVLDVQPKLILVPTSLETETEILLRSMADPSATHAGVTNVFHNRLTPISDPRLDAESEQEWYLIGDKAQYDIIEMAYLDGQAEPEVLEDEVFDSDGFKYKCRHIFGAGVMDDVALYKNTGPQSGN